MKRFSFLVILLTFLAVLLACSASGCSFVKDIFAPDASGDPSVTAAPESISFKGFERVLEIPVSEEEGCVKSVVDAEGNTGLVELRAVGDDEFIILDAVNKELVFINRAGESRTLSLPDVCREPKRVACENGVIAVLDAQQIVFMDEQGQVTRTMPLPAKNDDYYYGISVFEFENGGLLLQLYTDSAYLLDDSGYKEVAVAFHITHTMYYADIRSGINAWIVKNNNSPVNPIAARGNKLLAMTYDDSNGDQGMLAGIYYAESDLSAVTGIEREGMVCVHAPNDLAMSPSGRVYMLTCFEDHVEITELIFG